MSALAGIVRFDGRPVGHEEIESFAARLNAPSSGPIEFRVSGPIGFALAPLDTDGGNSVGLAPARDAPVVLFDGRIDARAELRAGLREAGISELDIASRDQSLVGAAWRAWGEQCPRRLLGDFAFAIWDERRARLFCARDPLGVKPFFYTRSDERLLFSSSLECLRSRPGVSDAIDERTAADFLLVGHRLSQDASIYRDISRLAPGHALAWDAHRGLRVERWFDLALEDPIEGRAAKELVEEFRALLDAAVTDRLRGQRALVSMSGGLDSTSVAAAAKRRLGLRGDPFEIRAFNVIYPHLLRDEEDRFARAAADHLGIPLEVVTVDRIRELPGQAARFPEPVDASAFDLFAFSAEARLTTPEPVLTGEGGDVGFYHDWRYASGYLRAGRWLSLARAAFQHVGLLRRVPPLYLRTRLRRALGKRSVGRSFPPWLRPELVERHALRERFDAFMGLPPRHGPARSAAHHLASLTSWSVLFEREDPSVTGLPLEFRHPYFDLRMMRFMLRLPEIPWCVDKSLQRLALIGVLPESVRMRPKAPFPGFPEYEALRERGIPEMERLLANETLCDYVDVDRVRRLLHGYDKLRPSEVELLLRPLGFAAWLARHGEARGAQPVSA